MLRALCPRRSSRVGSTRLQAYAISLPIDFPLPKFHSTTEDHLSGQRVPPRLDSGSYATVIWSRGVATGWLALVGHHLKRLAPVFKKIDSAGTMSRRSLRSSPTRVTGWPQSGVPQAVLSGLVMGFDATQVFGQGLAARAPARCLRSGRCLGPGGLKLGELRLQGYFVLQQLALNSVGCSPAIGAPYEAPFQHCPSSTESSSRPGSDGRDLKVAPTRSDARSRVRDRDGSPNDVWQRLGVLAVRPAPR